MIKNVLRVVAVVLVLILAILIAWFSIKNTDLNIGLGQNKIKNNQIMNTTNIKITPNKLENTVWKKGSKQAISWSVENLPEGEYVTEIKLIDTATDKVVGSIPSITSETANGSHKIEYGVGSLLFGGDAIQPLNPGKYQLKFQILKLEKDDGTVESYKPKYSPEYFFEVAAESLGDVVEVVM